MENGKWTMANGREEVTESSAVELPTPDVLPREDVGIAFKEEALLGKAPRGGQGGKGTCAGERIEGVKEDS